MLKVRWSSRCAGGCGAWLLVGSRAVRAHRAFWCPTCWAKHAPGCTLHHDRTPYSEPRRPAKVTTPADQGALF